jgi:hypothetical protein
LYTTELAPAPPPPPRHPPAPPPPIIKISQVIPTAGIVKEEVPPVKIIYLSIELVIVPVVKVPPEGVMVIF